MTDQHDDEGVDWGDMQAPDGRENQPDLPAAPQWEPKARASYPDNGPLQEAPISINFRVTGEPQITVRGFNGADINEALRDLSENGCWANIAAAQADLRGQGQLGAGLGPMTPVPPAQPAPGGYAPPQQSPGAPPFGPNVSAPSAPGYMPPQQSFPSGPPQTGGWGGGNGGGQPGRAEPKPQPPGWMRLNARSGPGFDAWKSMREQYKDNFRGKVQWGGKSDYWVEPSVAQWLSQQGFAVTP